MKNKCILCRSKRIYTKEKYKTDDINYLYSNKLGILEPLPPDRYLEYKKCTNCDIKFFEPQYQGDEYFYERLQNFHWYYMDEKPEYEFAKKFIPTNGNILEVGSGKAIFSKNIQNKLNYTGLEFNDAAIRRAQDFGITLLKESVEEHAKRGIKYDAIFSFQVLEHVNDPGEFIKSCVECLKINGYLIIAVPNNDGLCGISTNNFLNFPPHHSSHWGKETFVNMAKIFNIDLIEMHEEKISTNHLIWAKKTVIYNKINKYFGVKFSQIDNSFFSKVNSFFSSILSRILPINTIAISGHTITAIFKKSN